MIECIEFNSAMNDSGIRFKGEDLAGLNSHKNHGFELAHNGQVNVNVIDRSKKLLMRYNIKTRFG